MGFITFFQFFFDNPEYSGLFVLYYYIFNVIIYGLI